MSVAVELPALGESVVEGTVSRWLVNEGDRVELQSKSGQPLARYFPEVVEALLALKAKRFILDGELVIPDERGHHSFDALLQRIHPAESRIRRLAEETARQLAGSPAGSPM